MKKIITTLSLSLVLAAGLFAQVSAANVEKAYTILEATDDVLAYHGDYSATVSFQIEKPGKPKESVQYKIFERTDKKLMTLVQLFPDLLKVFPGLALFNRIAQQVRRMEGRHEPDAALADELRRQNLVKSDTNNLEQLAYEVNASISSEAVRNAHILAGA